MDDIAYRFLTLECFKVEDKRRFYLGICGEFDEKSKYHCYNCRLDFLEGLKELFNVSFWNWK